MPDESPKIKMATTRTATISNSPGEKYAVKIVTQFDRAYITATAPVDLLDLKDAVDRLWDAYALS